MAQKPTAKKSVADDPRYTQALQSYEAGLRAMQEHKFEKAKPHFQKVVGSSIRELTDRASLHLNICNQHIERSSANQFKSTEEHFDYAVSLMNVGDYVTAREHLDKLLKQSPKTDYVVYGLAAPRIPALRKTTSAKRSQRSFSRGRGSWKRNLLTSFPQERPGANVAFV